MKKTLSLFVVALLIWLVGCKLDPPVFPNGTPKSDSYQPVTKGTYWKYNGNISGVTLTQTTTMTGATETFSGRLYYVGSTVMGGQSENSYFYHGDGKYTMRSTTVASGITIEYTYLVDNMTVGQKWTAPVSDSGTINGVPGQIVGEIKEVNISRQIAGTTFNNVVHTQMLFQYNFTGTMETVQVLDFYIAKGIGLIEMNTAAAGITGPSGLISSTTLSGYSIK